MVVCHCNAVSDRAVRRAVRGGACTRNAVARACAAGHGCGGCAAVIDEIIASERVSAASDTQLPVLGELSPAR